MKNLIEILFEKGYKSYIRVEKSNWNKEAKKQAQRILEENEVIFTEGNFNSDTSTFYVPTKFNTFYHRSNYNTSRVGGLETHFVKDLDFDNAIVWGLHEYKKTPTLIYPRPNIRVKKYKDFNGIKALGIDDERSDDCMNLCLSKENHLDIFNNLNTNHIFKYDLTYGKLSN